MLSDGVFPFLHADKTDIAPGEEVFLSRSVVYFYVLLSLRKSSIASL